MIRAVRAFDEGTLAETLDRIPVALRPKGGAHSRCCVYHDRAVLKYRLMALLGFAAEDESDEAKTLKEYHASAPAPAHPLTVCGAACSRCPPAQVVVTPNCRGCFARPCQYACPKKAISVAERSAIDQAKCIKCGRCIAVCPFHAIVKTTVPCEEACPVGAIRKDESGVAAIDFERCVYCGKCFAACPFGAVMECSQMLEALAALKRGEKIVAMIAPSAQGQFPGTIGQLISATRKLGFEDVMEVALGAELTTAHETEEFLERTAKDPKSLMTSSCCPAYVNLVRKHLPEFMEHVSETPSPMVFAHRLAKEKHPGAKTLFIGPCVAKRGEAREKGIDYVLSFEELGAILAGRKIDVIACGEDMAERPAAATARNFAHSCGVTEAVLAEASAKIEGFRLDSKSIDGIDKKTLSLLKLHHAGKLSANFLEVMACAGGCCKGPSSLMR